MENLLADKAKGTQPAGAEQPAAAATVVDLMAALRQSVESARESRGEGQSEDATVHDMPQRATKSPAKKAGASRPRSA
ncbi:hypothetical protein [Streptomyces chryseus]|uniref:hypothetical protein n=1 Tax=Streptomyces chryseus TaxID=68186 RepID=UPI00110F86DE|nr:hypothetical protein [Streptomyces chryseus]